MARVVLAYSGGLDTSVAIRWLRDTKGLEVVTFSADLGQAEELPPTRERALKNGAVEAYIADLKDEFVNDFIFPAIRANAYYGDGYLLATALGRPLIAKELVRYARRTGAEFVAHGCTGKGNDQVRFETTIAALASDIRVIAPLREWHLKSREDEIAYAKAAGLDIGAVSAEKPYSYDRNLWGVSIECGVLEDPWAAPPEDAFVITSDPRRAPDAPEELVIAFAEGAPVGLDGRDMPGAPLIDELNRRAGAHGVGRIDVIEDRLVGIKSREVYEAPAATVIMLAHRSLEHLALPKDLIHQARQLSQRYGELVYNGLWYTGLRRSLDAFFAEANRNVTGEVRIRLHKGQALVVGRRSPKALYVHTLSTYDASDQFDHGASVGFIRIWSLPVAVAERVDRQGKDGKREVRSGK